MDLLNKIFIKLGQLDRRFIFLLIGLSVLIPLLKPDWINIPIKTTYNSKIVFQELNNLNSDFIPSHNTSSSCDLDTARISLCNFISDKIFEDILEN